MTDYKNLFKNKDFLALWASQFFSQMALHTMNFLVILLVFQKTGSTLATSIVWLVYILPAILIGPLAAAYVDLIDKKQLLIFTNVSQALLVAGFSFVYAHYLFLAYAVVLLYSLLNQFYTPAEIASLPMLVKRQDLPQANGLFLGTYQIGLVVGAGVSGVIGDALGFRNAFLISASALTLAYVAVNFLPKLQTKKDAEEDIRQNIKEYLEDVWEGISFIKNHKNIWVPFVTIAGLQVSLAIVFTNLPAIAEVIIKINPNYAGVYIVGPAGLGAVLGILSVPRALKTKTKKQLAKIALFVLSLGLIIVATIIPGLPSSFSLPISIFMFALAGISFIGIFIPAQTFLQEQTPSDMMGRVFGNAWFITTVATVFPLIFSASITEVFGPRFLFLFFGVILFMIYVYYNKIVDFKVES